MIVLPAFPQLPAYRYTITLEGSEYQLRFYWLQRSRSWYMDILEVDGTELATGMRLTVLWPMTIRKRDPRLPPGQFLCVCREDVTRDISAQSDLGSTHFVAYYPQGDLVTDPEDPDYTITVP